jgi:hypothetical protein
MSADELRQKINELVRQAIADEYFTASGERVMLPLDDLISLGCADEMDRIDLRVAINSFNDRNPKTDG